jgi:CRISPR/Cas system CSM-associated protein Csm2 small subunit
MSKRKDLDRNQIVTLLRSALVEGVLELNNVPELLQQILEEELWQEEILMDTGEVVTMYSFVDFIKTPPPAGLGTTFETLWQLCCHNPLLLDLLDRAVQRPAGAPEKNQRVVREQITVDSIHNSDKIERPTGTSKQAGLRQLRKKNPELHAKVLAGELTVNAAMVQAGLRTKQVTVFVDAHRAVKKLKKTFEEEDFIELVALLMSVLPEQKERVVEKFKQVLDEKQLTKIKDFLASL